MAAAPEPPPTSTPSPPTSAPATPAPTTLEDIARRFGLRVQLSLNQDLATYYLNPGELAAAITFALTVDTAKHVVKVSAPAVDLNGVQVEVRFPPVASTEANATDAAPSRCEEETFVREVFKQSNEPGSKLRQAYPSLTGGVTKGVESCPPEKASESNLLVLVIIAVGLICIIAMWIVFCCWYCKRKKKEEEEEEAKSGEASDRSPSPSDFRSSRSRGVYDTEPYGHTSPGRSTTRGARSSPPRSQAGPSRHRSHASDSSDCPDYYV
eukprot:TRINITY_DN17674_c1_g1_i1.p1 TRINITY_DN17674_c1_g1~~TRINITY_DN17674_c1_g1_i1.p1  ORF type:complete len:301 (+),score=81.86 TRINITY_DN17674_c1_g1_i1:103-903(+)